MTFQEKYEFIPVPETQRFSEYKQLNKVALIVALIQMEASKRAMIQTLSWTYQEIIQEGKTIEGIQEEIIKRQALMIQELQKENLRLSIENT